jgi:hypothetical protein
MRIAGQDHRWRGEIVREHGWQKRIRIVAAVSAVSVLCGCSGATSSLPSIGGGLPSWFRSSSPAAQAQASAPQASLTDDCPSMDIRTGAATLAVAAKGQQPTANELRYQLTFTELARQCFVEGGNVRMRVGVHGRAVVGPAGAPPQVSVPIRYAVVREGVQPTTITTKFKRIAVTLPPGTGNVVFTDIEEDLSFPLPPLPELQAYVVYVGFDEVGDQQQRPQPAKKKSPRR